MSLLGGVLEMARRYSLYFIWWWLGYSYFHSLLWISPTCEGRGVIFLLHLVRSFPFLSFFFSSSHDIGIYKWILRSFENTTVDKRKVLSASSSSFSYYPFLTCCLYIKWRILSRAFIWINIYRAYTFIGNWKMNCIRRLLIVNGIFKKTIEAKILY